MAIDPKNASHIQIGITLMESFLDALPEYFRVGNDQKLHHDPHDVNVFAHKKLTGKHMFADSYGEYVASKLLPIVSMKHSIGNVIH